MKEESKIAKRVGQLVTQQSYRRREGQPGGRQACMSLTAERLWQFKQVPKVTSHSRLPSSQASGWKLSSEELLDEFLSMHRVEGIQKRTSPKQNEVWNVTNLLLLAAKDSRS
jgi:hypothetical protein